MAVTTCWRLLVGSDFLLAMTSYGGGFLWRWWLKASHSEQMRPCLKGERVYINDYNTAGLPSIKLNIQN